MESKKTMSRTESEKGMNTIGIAQSRQSPLIHSVLDNGIKMIKQKMSYKTKLYKFTHLGVIS